MLVEMKSKGKDLDKAFKQAKDYLPGLKDHELPQYILLSDFENFRLIDLEEEKEVKFKLKDFVKNVQQLSRLKKYPKVAQNMQELKKAQAEYGAVMSTING